MWVVPRKNPLGNCCFKLRGSVLRAVGVRALPLPIGRKLQIRIRDLHSAACAIHRSLPLLLLFLWETLRTTKNSSDTSGSNESLHLGSISLDVIQLICIKSRLLPAPQLRDEDLGIWLPLLVDNHDQSLDDVRVIGLSWTDQTRTKLQVRGDLGTEMLESFGIYHGNPFLAQPGADRLLSLCGVAKDRIPRGKQAPLFVDLTKQNQTFLTSSSAAATADNDSLEVPLGSQAQQQQSRFGVNLQEIDFAKQHATTLNSVHAMTPCSGPTSARIAEPSLLGDEASLAPRKLFTKSMLTVRYDRNALIIGGNATYTLRKNNIVGAFGCGGTFDWNAKTWNFTDIHDLETTDKPIIRVLGLSRSDLRSLKTGEMIAMPTTQNAIARMIERRALYARLSVAKRP